MFRSVIRRYSKCAASLAVLALIAAALTAPLAASPTQSRKWTSKEERRAEREAVFLAQQPQTDESVAPQGAGPWPCVAGMADTFPCDKVELLAYIPMSAMGASTGNDGWGWTDPSTGREYALMGLNTGTRFFDITDPVNPVDLGHLPTHTSNSAWRDIKVYSDHAYIVSEATGHGMQVFDLTQLRDVVGPPITFGETAHYDDFGDAHNIVINEDTGYAYAVGTGTCAGGPHFIDLSSPRNPTYAGCHIETIYTHDAQCVVYHGPDLVYQGREVCINSNEDSINIIDVTDKSLPSVISETGYGGVGYTHQGWLTEDHRYYVQGDELDEQQQGHNTWSRIFDVKELAFPDLIGTYVSSTPAIDHNMYSHNGYMYQANYRAGLRVLDLADIDSGTMTEVAYFDTYPANDNASFSGAWSVYPYFESGTILISGYSGGMYLVRVELDPDFQLDIADTVLEVCDPGFDGSTIDVSERNGYNGDVTLSTTGLPAGAIESFTTNPVTVPGTTELQIDTTGVAGGSYELDLEVTDGSITRNETITLKVAGSIPAQPAPLSPSNGATAVSRMPTLSWGSAGPGSSYSIDVSTDSGFGAVVFSGSTGAESLTLIEPLAASTTYYWRATPTNACGVGPASAVQSFTTLAIPPILLVDDDDNSPDVRDTYIETLSALGEDFDVWDTENTDSEPSAAALAPYQAVIWFSGDEFGGAAGPGGGGEAALQAWLADSACLLLASQDYYYDRGLTSLLTTELGISGASSDVGHTSADGQGSVFAGLGPYGLSFPYSNYTDVLTPDGTAEAAFMGSEGVIAADKDTGVYRTAYLTFGIEGLPSDTDRQAVLSAFLGWCDALDGVDGDSDGETNGTDCAPGDASAWALPSEARDLIVDSGGLNWLAPIAPGGSSTLYDLLRADSATGFAAAACLESGDGDTVAVDGDTPALDATYYYLVRARNACGGNVGESSAGVPRDAAGCP